MVVSSSILKILTKAVQKKHSVAIKYAGSAQIITIEPHAIYLDRNSDIAIDCFQKNDSVGELLSYGTWTTIAWRNIDSVFWLSTTFSPRIKEGFTPTHDKYKRGLVAIIDTGINSNVDDVVLRDIESSVDQLLANPPAPPKK